MVYIDLEKLRNILVRPSAVSYPMTAEYTPSVYDSSKAITREDFKRTMEMLSGANHHLTSANAINALNMSGAQLRYRRRQSVQFDPPSGYQIQPTWEELVNPCKEEPIMSERMPIRAKIIRLISENETEDEIYREYVGKTFDVVSEGTMQKGVKGYRLCLDSTKYDLDAVRFGVDELELYYDDEPVGGEY